MQANKKEVKFKNNKFNLIKKKVEVRKKVAAERDWYSLLNVLIISIVIILAVIAYLIKINFNSRLDKQKENVMTLYNGVETNQSAIVLDQRIRAVTGKYTQYQKLVEQNIDFNKFYTTIANIDPNLKVDSISIKPGSVIEVTVSFSGYAYDNIGYIISKIENESEIEDSSVKSITFSISEETRLELASSATSTEEMRDDLISYLNNRELINTSIVFEIPIVSLFEKDESSTDL